MKKLNILTILSFVLFVASSCSKNDPVPEIDQEEVGSAKLVFTEVEREAHGDHYHYNAIKDPKIESVTFSGSNMAPAVGAHLHLEVGKTYRLNLIATDFMGRETQETFVQRADVHQAFLLGAPEGALTYVYAERDENKKALNVGVTGYVTVEKESGSFVFRYIMRHLNTGVKSRITAADWNNNNFSQFTGANDLDLKVELHLVAEAHTH